MEIKSFESVEFKSDPEGTIVAQLCRWDKRDKAGDIIRKGAFARTLAELRATGDPLPMIFSHCWEDPKAYIGQADPGDAQEAADGLKVKGLFDFTSPNGATVFAQLKRRVLREWSFGFIIRKAKDLGKGTRELLDVDLFE